MLLGAGSFQSGDNRRYFHHADFFARRSRCVSCTTDCYVAVCGLPTANDDHAVVMAQFARKCLYQASALLELLVPRLGEDTRNLGLRVGLHSGAVTAGVLRGGMYYSYW